MFIRLQVIKSQVIAGVLLMGILLINTGLEAQEKFPYELKIKEDTGEIVRIAVDGKPVLTGLRLVTSPRPNEILVPGVNDENKVPAKSKWQDGVFITTKDGVLYDAGERLLQYKGKIVASPNGVIKISYDIEYPKDVTWYRIPHFEFMLPIGIYNGKAFKTKKVAGDTLMGLISDTEYINTGEENISIKMATTVGIVEFKSEECRLQIYQSGKSGKDKIEFLVVKKQGVPTFNKKFDSTFEAIKAGTKATIELEIRLLRFSDKTSK